MSEHTEQVALFSWVGYKMGEYPKLEYLFAIPNGTYASSKFVGARMKAEGVSRGVPDICLPVSMGGYHGLFIELKIKGGKLSREQRRWLDVLGKEGYLAVCCEGWMAAAEVLENYLNQEQKS